MARPWCQVRQAACDAGGPFADAAWQLRQLKLQVVPRQWTVWSASAAVRRSILGSWMDDGLGPGADGHAQCVVAICAALCGCLVMP